MGLISFLGIEIREWHVKMSGDDDKTAQKKIEFSCWDFAGQMVYYPTHQVCY